MPLKSRPEKPSDDYLVYDIETSPSYEGEPLNTCFLGAGTFDGTTYRLHSSLESLADYCIEALPTRDKTIYAHNGAKYDMLYLLPELIKSGHTWHIFGGSRFFAKGNTRTFADSMAILPKSLAAISDDLGLELKKGSIDYKDIVNQDWEPYLENDCRILYEAISRLRHTVYNLGGQVRLTLASTALDLFRRKYLDRIITWGSSQEEHERAALYGGRTEVFRTRANNVEYYDINSSYSASALEPVPIRYMGKTVSNSWGDCDIIKAQVSVPDMRYPPLPYRQKGKLIFPTGRWIGYYVGAELSHAVSCGVNVTVLERHIYKASPILASYSKEIYKLKQDGNPAAKLLLNALYGRFAMKLEKEQILLNPSLETLQGLDQDLVPYKTIGNDIISYTESSDGFIFPAVFATITARARVRLHKALLASDGKAVYCDTDSIILEAPSKKQTPEIGDELGQWKLEGKHKRYRALAPKVYQLDKTTKAKGVRLPKDYAELEENCYVPNVRMRGLKETLTKPDNYKLYVGTKSIGFIRGDKRVWDKRKLDSKPLKIYLDD